MKNKKAIVDVFYGVGQGWCVLCTMVITSLILLFAIFGGTIHIQINFNSWGELIKTIRK
jgi:hypothetical protein